MKTLVLEERVSRAVELFRSGYNCAQAVTGAYGDLYGFTLEQCVRMSASFGGGIGRMRETCGAACGMFLVTGLETGSVNPGDRAGKGANYKIVQELAAEFTRRNGALKCGTLLGLKSTDLQSSTPQKRDEAYFAKRPCVKIVEEAALILGEFLIRNRK